MTPNQRRWLVDLLPEPDGAIDAFDRAMLVDLYPWAYIPPLVLEPIDVSLTIEGVADVSLTLAPVLEDADLVLVDGAEDVNATLS